MVETRHFRASSSVVEEDYDPIDHYLWVIEPTRDGELYMSRLDHGMVGFEVPTLLASLSVAGIEVTIDGRQKNKVFYFPILQTPRNLLRESANSVGVGFV